MSPMIDEKEDKKRNLKCGLTLWRVDDFAGLTHSHNARMLIAHKHNASDFYLLFFVSLRIITIFIQLKAWPDVSILFIIIFPAFMRPHCAACVCVSCSHFSIVARCNETATQAIPMNCWHTRTQTQLRDWETTGDHGGRIQNNNLRKWSKSPDRTPFTAENIFGSKLMSKWNWVEPIYLWSIPVGRSIFASMMPRCQANA